MRNNFHSRLIIVSNTHGPSPSSILVASPQHTYPTQNIISPYLLNSGVAMWLTWASKMSAEITESLLGRGLRDSCGSVSSPPPFVVVVFWFK